MSELFTKTTGVFLHLAVPAPGTAIGIVTRKPLKEFALRPQYFRQPSVMTRHGIDSSRLEKLIPVGLPGQMTFKFNNLPVWLIDCSLLDGTKGTSR
jgi:hypothetical protein